MVRLDLHVNNAVHLINCTRNRARNGVEERGFGSALGR